MLQPLGEKVRGAAVPQWLQGEELLGLLVSGELVRQQESSPEVVITVVTRGGEDVGHTAGGHLWQDGAKRAKWSRWDVVPRKRNWASATPSQAAGLAVQKSGSLKKRGGCPGGAATASWSAASSSCTLMLTVRKKSAKKSSWGHQMLRLVWLVID